jgi:acetyl esterase/lipase
MPAGIHPPIDAELAAALAAFGPGASDPLLAAEIPARREARKALRLTDDDLRRGGAIEFTELSVPGPEGAPDISLLVCRPAALTTRAPAVFHIHGGGMVVGDNRTGMLTMLDWIQETGVVVVSVEYRLAPEHPHPAPVQDCYAGLTWTAAHAAELGIDPDRLLIAGASAGGGLSAAVALMARDRGGPALIGQMLGCAMLDDRNQTPSSHELDREGDVGPDVQPDRLAGPARRGPGRPGRVAVRGAGQGRRPVRAAPRLPGRRLGGDVPGRGARLRGPDLAGRRRGRTARLAGRLSRF